MTMRVPHTTEPTSSLCMTAPQSCRAALPAEGLSGVKARKPTPDDVYGSTWLTAGTGSVILLNGEPGDPIVIMHHLKKPVAEGGPY
jgi:hypothetical protein